MKKYYFFILSFLVILSSVVVGCGPKKASSVNDAIRHSETMNSVQAKEKYLVGQAKAFYNAKDYDGAMNIAQNVIRKLNSDSQEAKKVIEDAKKELIAKSQKATEDLKKKLSEFGK